MTVPQQAPATAAAIPAPADRPDHPHALRTLALASLGAFVVFLDTTIVNVAFEAISHSGITLGIIIGRLLSQEVVEGTVDKLLRPFRPGRF